MVRSNRIQKLFMIVMAAILLLSQAGLFGMQPVNAASLESAVTVSAVDEEGKSVLDMKAVEIAEGDTAFDVLQSADPKLKYSIHETYGESVDGIGGIPAEGTYFWAFYLNGEQAQEGVGSSEVSNGDNIQFIYTNWDDSDPVEIDMTFSAVNGNEEVIKEELVSMYQYATAYDALRKVAKSQGVNVSATIDSQYFAGIDYLNEPLPRDCEYWSFLLNGDYAQTGLSGYTLQDGDVIELVVDNWCEPEEEEEEETGETEEPSDEKEDANEENINEETNYEEVLQSTLNYLIENPNQMDWYGFSTLHSADKNISKAMADDIVSTVTAEYTGSPTDIAKDIIILTSVGYDATDINGVNLVNLLIEQDMVASNQLVYSLLAINSGGYDIPEAESKRIIDAILDIELSAGGWSFFGETPSPDITGIALVALAPYKDQENVAGAINRAVSALSSEQGELGGYDVPFNGGYSAESAALAIVGLSSVGVDATSEAFTKTEGNLLEHLFDYQMEDGSFKHLTNDSNSSVFATNQAALALVAYDKLKNGNGTVFNFVPEDSGEEEPEEEPEEENPEVDPDKDDKEDGGDENEEGSNGKKDEDSDNSSQVKVTLENLKDFENKGSLIVKPESGKKESNFEVTIVQEVASQLVKENKELVIDNEDAMVTIPSSVLKQLSESGEAFEVILVEKEAEGALGAIYDFTIKVGNEIISEFDEAITIGLAVDSEKVKDIDSDRVKAFYYNDKTEEWEVILDSEYDSNTGFVTFTTTHFSTFGVFEYDGAEEVPGGEGQEDPVVPTTSSESTTAQGQELPKTATNMFNLLMLGFALTLTGVAILYIKNRKEKATE